jgi:hypothetical protein
MGEYMKGFEAGMGVAGGGELVRREVAVALYEALKVIPVGRIPSHLRLQVRDALAKAEGVEN